MLTRSHRVGGAVAIASLLGLADAAGAGVSLRSTIGPSAGNHNPGGGSISIAYLGGGFFLGTDNTVLAESDQFQFTGMNGAGDQQTMTYSYDAAAQSDYGVLRARFSHSLTNSFHNPANTRWIDDQTTGVPSYFTGQSFTRFNDDITVAAAGDAASVSFVMRITGEVSSVPLGSFGQIALWRELPSGGTTTFERFNSFEGSGPLTVDELVETPTFALNNGVVSVGLGLQTWLTMDLTDDGFPDGSDASLSVDAFNTMRIADIIIRDAAGNELDATSIMGSSGLDYLAFIPTPGAASLLGAAAAMTLPRRRRA
ncbi:MAG: hypothetical protein ACTS27_10055 [Phycisphaerales bacterium]